MQPKPEEIMTSLEILALTVNLIVESLNAFTVAIGEQNRRIEVLEEFVKHEQ